MIGRRGATLIEVMVVIAIMAILGTGLLVSVAGGRSRASSQALAERMAEVFKQARETAIAQQRPVAVLLPATPTSPLADSYYLADGIERAVVKRRFSFAEEVPGTYLFSGHWDLASGANSAPGPLPGANGGELDVSAWTLEPGHAAYVYTPAGTLQSNRVEFAGAYHLVVCQAAGWSSQAVGTASSARLDSVNSPVTLRLSKAGGVSVVPQVENQAGLDIGGAAPFSGTLMAALGPLSTGNDPPVLVSVEVDPEPEDDTVPDYVDGTVAMDGYLTMKVKARDPDGDPLEVMWTASAVRPAGGELGSVSSPIRTQTSFEGENQCSTWEWRPPPDSVSGNLYSLSVEVRDPSNAVADGGTMALHRVEIVEPGTILFVDTRNGGNPELYTMNTDGTNEMRLSRSPGFDESWPQLSPDGARVMYVRRPTGPDVGGGVLMTVGIDGQNPKRVLQPSDLPPHPGPIHPVESIVGSCWSPDGSQVAVIARYGGPTGGLDIYVCDADGSSPTRAHSATAGLSVTSASKVTWHWDPPYDRGDMDRQRLIFTSPYDSRYFTFYLDGRTEMAHNGRVITDINAGPSGDVAWVEGGRLMVGDFDPVSGLSAGTSIGGGLTNIAGPAWSPSGHRLVFSGQATGPNIRLYRVDAGGANQVRLTNTATALEASWGP